MNLSLGEASSEDDAANKAQMEKTEISLTLSNKFEVLDDEQSDIHSLLVRLVSLGVHAFHVVFLHCTACC